MTNGVRLLVYWGVNVLALIVVDWLFDGVTIGGWGSLLLGAAVLGFGELRSSSRSSPSSRCR